MNTFSLWGLVVVGGVACALVGAYGFRLTIAQRRPTGWTYIRSAAFAVAAVAVGVAIGRLSLWGDVRQLDESIHESIFIVQHDLAVRTMLAVTGIGAITATGFLTVLLGAVAGYHYRSLRLLLVPLVAYVLALQGQRFVDRLDARSRPPVDLSVGPPGGYPSGGTVRIVLVVGLLLVVFAQIWRREHETLLLGAAWGSIAWVEIVSRSILGRHWPIDLLGGVAIGVLLLAAAGPLMWLPGSTADRRVAEPDAPGAA